MSPHSQIGLLRITSVLVLLAWISLLSIAIVTTCGILECSSHAYRGFELSGLSLVITGTLAIALAQKVRCPKCHQKMLNQKLVHKHPHAEIMWPFDYWSTGIIRVLKGQPITCMYCGTKFRTREDSKRRAQ